MKIDQLIGYLGILLLTACGGGGGSASSPPPPPLPPPPANVASGQFKDANVAGLAYATATQSGTTDASGTFRYQAGETIVFNVGAVSIGFATGDDLLTPLNLVAGGNADDAGVQNIVRFLLMLDQNADADDGITISSAVSQVAENWAQVDFAALDLDNELVTIVSDVASVDGRAASLPSAQAAKSHLESTFHCAFSGFFIGERSQGGAPAGRIALLMNPATGIMRAGFAGNLSDFVGSQPVSVDQQREFSLSRADGDSIAGHFDSRDELSGTWSIGGQSGDFSASRWILDHDAAVRLVGQFSQTTIQPVKMDGILALAVDSGGQITGKATRLVTAEEYGLAGSLDGQDITFVSSINTTFTGILEEQLRVIGESFSNNGGRGVWNAQGCKLN